MYDNVIMVSKFINFKGLALHSLEHLGLRRNTINRIQLSTKATPELVTGKVVIGTLPLFLASFTKCVIEIPVVLPVLFRDPHVSLELLIQYARPPRIYTVTGQNASIRNIAELFKY